MQNFFNIGTIDALVVTTHKPEFLIVTPHVFG
jgi:hypothetical protein